jgi:hypothetical protein
MDIKRKLVVFKPGRIIYFSTYLPPTLIELSYRLTSAHLHFNLFVISEILVIKVEALYATNTSLHEQELFLEEYPLH